MTIYNSIDVELVDGQGRTTTLQIVAQSEIDTVAEAQTAFDAWYTDFSAVSGGGVKKATVSFPLTLTPSSADADSNVDENAWLDVTVEDGGSPKMRLPMPKKTDGVYNFIVGGQVDSSDTDLIAWVDNYKAAGSFTLGKTSARNVSTLNGGYLERK